MTNQVIPEAAVEAERCAHYDWTGPESAYECPASAAPGSVFCVDHSQGTKK